MGGSKRKITKADLDAAATLRHLWETRRPPGMTQQTAAGIFGWSQGAVSQYMTGKLALGPVATLKFARLLGVEPTEIRADFDPKKVQLFELSPDVMALAAKIAALPESKRPDVDKYVDFLLSTSYRHIPKTSPGVFVGGTVHAFPKAGDTSKQHRRDPADEHKPDPPTGGSRKR